MRATILPAVLLLAVSTTPAAEAEIRTALAVAHESERRFGEAEREWRNVLALSGDSRAGARAQFRLASLAERSGDAEQAALAFTRTLAAYAALPRETRDPEPGLAEANLARIRTSQGRLSDAVDHYERGVPVLHALLGGADPRVRRAVSAFAAVHDQPGRIAHSQDDSANATAHYRSAVSVHERWGSPNAPDLATTLHSLGVLYHTDQNLPDAEATYRRALQILETTLGRSHARTGRLLHDLALVHAAQGDLHRADSELRESLAILDATLGSDDPSSQRARESLSQLAHRSASP